MHHILAWIQTTYLQLTDWIDLAKDIVFFSGAIVAFKYLKNKNFLDVTQKIKTNLHFRSRIEDDLNNYVYDRYKNGKKDIAIRFVYWKNYPWKLDYDGFSHFLFCRSFDNKSLPFGFIEPLILP